MSDLVAIAYDDQETAESVRTTLADLSQEKIVELDDAGGGGRRRTERGGCHDAAYLLRCVGDYP
jgi:uncharacterized membrane protein